MTTEYLNLLKARWLETYYMWLSTVFSFELRDSRQSASKWVILMDPTYINGLFVYPGAAVKSTPTWYFHLYTEPTCSLHVAQFKLPPLLQTRTMNASGLYCEGVPARIPNKTPSIRRFFPCIFSNPVAKCVDGTLNYAKNRCLQQSLLINTSTSGPTTWQYKKTAPLHTA
jgi:hypothetical protein